LKISLKTSKDGHSQVSLAQGFSYFSQLAQSVGYLSAIKTTLTSVIQLFGKDGGGFSISSSKSSKGAMPFLRNAPTDWNTNIRQLINRVKSSERVNDAITNSAYVACVAKAVKESKNIPELALVTICIPAYNNFLEVSTCIESIAMHPSQVHYQLLISDDASPDCTFSELANIPGIRVSRNKSNVGYINNVNTGTDSVSTEYLLTLNQDTIVCPGWLDELVLEMQRDPSNAVVGPCILSPSLTIQEAGGLIFDDARAAHRGRGFNAEDPRFSFSREVDYVSGCAMLVRTSVWKQLGGLNKDLSPAYYDDVDLCIRVHEAGMNVRYAPLAVVIHTEGTSMGREESDRHSLKHFQIINQAKVSSTHRKTLDLHTAFEHSPRVDTHYQKQQRVVCIFDTFPKSDRDGGSIDFEIFVDYLNQLKYEVIALFIHAPSFETTATWRANGVCCADYNSPYGKTTLKESTLICSFGIMAAIKLSTEHTSEKVWIHHTSDIVTRRVESFIALSQSVCEQSDIDLRWNLGLPRDVETMWQLEKPTIESPSATLFVTDNDLQFVTSRGAVGNFVHFPIFYGEPRGSDQIEPPADLTVGFVGSFLHSPNIDAVHYFLHSIWPTIRIELPNAKFLIWGSGLNEDLRTTWSKLPAVEVRGWFATWGDVVAETRVLVSPLRFGAGMKHKVVSNLIHGRPVVGTRISFEGFQTDLLGDNILTDDPTGMAKSIIEILLSDEVWQQALTTGREAMGSGFEKKAELKRVDDLLKSEIARYFSQPVTISKQ
jgi:GT2 family glycosyltransferase